MAKTQPRVTEDDRMNHILFIAGEYSGRYFSQWSYRIHPQSVHRIYEEWLTKSGLQASRDKSWAELESEKRLLAQQKAVWVSLLNVKHRPLDYLRKVIEYEDTPILFQDDQLSRMGSRLRTAKPNLQDIDGFFDMLAHLDRRSKFLWADPLYASGAQTWLDPLIRIWHRRGQWRNPIEDWRPGTRNRERQFASLLRFLLAQYDVPAFMDTVWLRNDRGSARLRDAWIHVASGRNIRTAKGLPMALSKRAAHNLSSAPEELSFEHALKWAHMQSFELRPRIGAAMLGSRWGGDFDNVDFWDSVLRFFKSNPMISPDRIGPIIDFIYAQKFEGPVLLIEGEDILRDDPPQPGFSMRNRQGQALLQQVEDWHDELARMEGRRGTHRRAMDGVYCASGWKIYGDTEKLNEEESLLWSFVEILSEDDLYNEGRLMRHCIYSYHARIASGECSVWSLRTTRQGGPHHGKQKRHLTVEVSANGTITEARGYANALPKGRSKELLKSWATRNRMSIAPYVFL